jgi:hypothetical protein
LFALFFRLSKLLRKKTHIVWTVLFTRKEPITLVKTAIYKIEKFKKLFPKIEIHRIYQVPEWKIQTGIYKTRLEADRVLNLVKRKYPGARVR